MIVPQSFESGALIAADRRREADTERLLAQAPQPHPLHPRHLVAVLLLRAGAATARFALRLDPSAHTLRGARSA